MLIFFFDNFRGSGMQRLPSSVIMEDIYGNDMSKLLEGLPADLAEGYSKFILPDHLLNGMSNDCFFFFFFFFLLDLSGKFRGVPTF
jgi:hypothetical protein